MNKWMNEKLNKDVNECMNEWVNLSNDWIYEVTNKWANKWMNDWMKHRNRMNHRIKEWSSRCRSESFETNSLRWDRWMRGLSMIDNSHDNWNYCSVIDLCFQDL